MIGGFLNYAYGSRLGSPSDGVLTCQCLSVRHMSYPKAYFVPALYVIAGVEMVPAPEITGYFYGYEAGNRLLGSYV